ncbi:MAG: hypothetical protein OEW95_06510 [Candidatus Bathyarchaeota archaeon]|nr:hypothetical protein [Candidatus Bathyarchaeota archaeon]
MIDITSINAVSGILAAVGVIVGVVFTVLQLRDLVKTRQTDLVTRLYSTFGSKEFSEVFIKVLNLEYKDYKDDPTKYPIQVTAFFEGIGILLKRKLIDIDIVDDLFSSPIKLSWETLTPIVEDYRKRFNRPQVCEWFEYLYNEMQKREQTLQST